MFLIAPEYAIIVVAHLLHRRAGRPHVAMRRVPDAVLVVEDVVLHAAVGGGRPKRVHEM